jgi:hypothetical protein
MTKEMGFAATGMLRHFMSVVRQLARDEEAHLMITCYLDSQDYSSLTDPKTLTQERIALRKSLTEFAWDRNVHFVFSAAAVCESVPLSPNSTHLAELKADLLSDLCGTNALLSFDRLLKAEVYALSTRSGATSSMLDTGGNWFPEIGKTEHSPESPWEYMRRLAELDLMGPGMSRQQRQAAAKKGIKNGKPRGGLKHHLNNQNVGLLADQLIAQMPMRPEHAEMMVRWSLGRASEEEFNEALIGSLRDPRWMMKWFSSKHSMSSPIAEIIRKPGRELGAAMRKLAEISVRWAALLESNNLGSDPTGRGGEIALRWTAMEEDQLVSLVYRAAANYGLTPSGVCAQDVDQFCPGVSTAIRSLFSSVWANVDGGRKEEPSDSQPVDALHAMYAPYVDVFRADRFMAPHIQKQVARHGTTVVPKLSQLPDVLKAKLALGKD